MDKEFKIISEHVTFYSSLYKKKKTTKTIEIAYAAYILKNNTIYHNTNTL